jgi:hypothetical protein
MEIDYAASDPGSSAPPPYFGRRPPSRLACGSVVAVIVGGLLLAIGFGVGCAMKLIGGH